MQHRQLHNKSSSAGTTADKGAAMSLPVVPTPVSLEAAAAAARGGDVMSNRPPHPPRVGNKQIASPSRAAAAVAAAASTSSAAGVRAEIPSAPEDFEEFMKKMRQSLLSGDSCERPMHQGAGNQRPVVVHSSCSTGDILPQTSTLYQLMHPSMGNYNNITSIPPPLQMGGVPTLEQDMKNIINRNRSSSSGSNVDADGTMSSKIDAVSLLLFKYSIT